MSKPSQPALFDHQTDWFQSSFLRKHMAETATTRAINSNSCLPCVLDRQRQQRLEAFGESKHPPKQLIPPMHCTRYLWRWTQNFYNYPYPTMVKIQFKQVVRVATQYAPPLLPRWRPSASRAAEQTQRRSTFPR